VSSEMTDTPSAVWSPGMLVRPRARQVAVAGVVAWLGREVQAPATAGGRLPAYAVH
jgi:hypothetical protein